MGRKKPFQRLKTKNPSMKTPRRTVMKSKQVEILDATIRKVWDKNDTVKRNFERIGLLADSNEIGPSSISEDNPVVQALEQKASEVFKPKRYQNNTEAIFAQQCIQKHGSNYAAMSKDLKLNINQYTEGQLRKKCEWYLSTQAEKQEEQLKEKEKKAKRQAAKAEATTSQD